MSLLSAVTPMSPRTRAALALPAIALAVVSVAGCGGSSSKASAAGTGAAAATSAPTSGAAGRNGFQAYLSCLSAHGVSIPTGRPGGGGFAGGARPSGAPRSGGRGFGGGFAQATSGPAAAAEKACASLRPTGGFGGGAGGSAAQNSQLTAYRSCLSDHGVTLPARPTGGADASARPRGGGLGALNTADPKTAAAVKACAALRPTFTARQGGGTPAPSVTPSS